MACIAGVHGDTFLKSLHTRHPETNMFIKYNQERIHSLLECFTVPPLYPGLYRPLTTSCYYHLGLKFFGNRIAPFKIVNLIVFVVNAFLLFLICRQFLSFVWALVAVALFASRRAHIHVLLFTVEFQTLMSVCFSLLMLYFFIRSRREGRILFEGLSYVFFVLALLSKESAVALALVVIVYGWLFDEHRNLRPYLIHIALAVGWARWFFFEFRGARDYRIVEFQYSYQPWDLFRNYVSYLLAFFNLLLPPIKDTTLQLGGKIEAVAKSAFAQVVFALIVLLDAAFVLLHKKVKLKRAQNPRLVAFGFAFFLISMVPYAIFQGRLFLRYSYVGHLGIAIVFSVVISAAVTAIWDRRRPSAQSALNGHTSPTD
jgi:hypothetical protein